MERLRRTSQFIRLTLKRITWNGGKIKTDNHVVGIIASTWHYAKPMAVCKELLKSKVPTCIWVEEHILEELSQKSKLRFHDQGYSTEIGSAVAKHLISLDHKDLSFISPWHGSQWSKNRYEGINSEIKKIEGTTHLFSLGNESEWDWLIPADHHVDTIKKKYLKFLEDLVDGPAEDIIAAIKLERGWNKIYHDLIPLFEQALKTNSTAWVLSNDPCALYAVKWLRSKGYKVPEDISVAGFDDSVEGLRSDLTSYNFSCSAMARSMIYQILSPYNGKSLTTHKGIVVARKSTAKPKKREP